MRGKQENEESQRRPPNIQANRESYIDDRWTEFKISGKNIQSRSHHVAAIHNDVLYVHGGYDADLGLLSDFYKMDLKSKEQGFKWVSLPTKDPNYPGKLKSHVAVVYKDDLVIFGGQTVELSNTNLVWKYNFLNEKWTKIVPNTDIPRLDSHKAVVRDNWMFVYGGFIDTQACYSASIYKFDLDSCTWEKLYSPKEKEKHPEPRGSTAMVLYENALWIFGGTNGKHTLNDVWRFNIEDLKWKEIQSTNNPEPRRSHTMVESDNLFWMFGGIQDVTKEKNDLNILDPKALEWTKILNTSNMVYECSPTMKVQAKNSLQRVTRALIQKESPNKNETKFSLGLSSAGHDDKDKTEGMKRILEENRQKKFMERKNQLLKNFLENSNEKKSKRTLSPTSESMLKTLELIGDQEQTKKSFQNEIMYDPSMKYVIGKKPCARDAHSCLVYNNKMLLMGGDRHLMSFSDLYFFDFTKGLESRGIYQKERKSMEIK